jgi:hypothetical protein
MTVARIFKEEMFDFLCDLESVIGGLHLTLNNATYLNGRQE